MNQYDAIVIGAGNGGLTSAATLAQSGKKVLLLEKHNIPGGCATSFCRGRFEFEVALHQLSGMGSESRPGPLRSVLKKLEVEEEIEWIEMDNLYRMVMPGEFDVTLPANKDELVSVLQKEFPDEKDNIKDFYDMVYQYITQWFTVSMKDPNEVTREQFPLYFKYHLKSAQEVVGEFISDKKLQMIINFYWCYMGTPPASLQFEVIAMCIFAYIEFKPYHMKGGSQVMSTALTEVIRKYNGDIKFNCEAKEILTENGSVCGVIAEDGSEYRAPYIVSNISPVQTYANLITDDSITKKDLYNLGNNTIGPSAIIMYIGLDAAPKELGFTESMNVFYGREDLDLSLEMSSIGTENDPFIVSCYTLDDHSFSPDGTSQVAVVCLKYGEPWAEIPPEQYHEIKYKCADTFLNRIEEQFPGFRDHIEEIEVATPLTCMRFLSHPGGAIYGFDKNIKNTGSFFQKESHIKGLHFAGTWTGWDGFQPTLSSGYAAGKEILKTMSRGAE